jgi:16S rRNA (guanine966-N2)-methyltransferase
MPAAKGRGWLRIVGGVWRGRKIAVPEMEDLRPTGERAREAIFNRLMHAEDTLGVRLKGAAVADLFAGTGALGLEALSRGAGSAVFVERDGAACKALVKVLETLGADDRAEVVHGDAATLAPRRSPVDIVLMDPPYAQSLITPTLSTLKARGWARAGTLIVAEVESGAELALAEGYHLIDRRKYGRAEIAFMTTD